MVPGDPAHTRGRCHDTRLRARLDDIDKTAIMVWFDVVDDDEVYLGGIDDLRDAREQLRHERLLDGVDEGGRIGAGHQVCVVRSPPRRLIAVEVPQIPVDRADPVDAFRDRHCTHVALLRSHVVHPVDGTRYRRLAADRGHRLHPRRARRGDRPPDQLARLMKKSAIDSRRSLALERGRASSSDCLASTTSDRA